MMGARSRKRIEGPAQHCGGDPDALLHPGPLEVMDSGFHGNPRWGVMDLRQYQGNVDGPATAVGDDGRGNRQDESGIGQQAVGVKGNMDAVGVAQAIAPLERCGCGAGFVFPKPLSPKPGVLSYHFNPPTLSSLRGIGDKSSTVPPAGGQPRCRWQSSRQE